METYDGEAEEKEEEKMKKVGEGITVERKTEVKVTSVEKYTDMEE